MRKITTLLLALISLCATAESRRLLTMEEAILSRELIPQNHSVVWDKGYPEEYLHRKGNSWYAVNIRSGEMRNIDKPARPKVEFVTVENNIVRKMADGTERKVTNFTDKISLPAAPYPVRSSVSQADYFHHPMVLCSPSIRKTRAEYQPSHYSIRRPEQEHFSR